MPLSGLLVLHRRKSARASGAAPVCPSGRPVFHLQTCLRELWIQDSSAVPAAALVAGPELERHRGDRAYEFLLRIGCGLDSEIKGESDVFGQLRDSWRAYEQAHPAHAKTLRSLVQRLFEDVKEIRTRHLRNLGSTTYGGLTRRLLGEDAKLPTLLIGAGHMARAVLPYLPAEVISVWNRNGARIPSLLAAMPDSPARSVRILPATAVAESKAWKAATNVVLCIPPDAGADATRICAWNARERSTGRVVHLGLLHAAGTRWDQLAGIATLQDLFGLQASHNVLREAQLARAAAACREKASLRALGGPLSLAHGWEDLSLFASTG